MPVSSRINRTYRLYVAAGLAGAALLLAGCASTPSTPPASLNEAKLSIQAAERQDVTLYASAELDKARQKLILADKAVAAEDMILAERFAQESTVTAQLAVARTEAAKAEVVNTEMRRGTEALMEEMRRTGDRQ